MVAERRQRRVVLSIGRGRVQYPLEMGLDAVQAGFTDAGLERRHTA